MTEKPRQATGEESGIPVGGARLAVARLKINITAGEIAKELHLDEPMVIAIEQNNFEMLGAPVFAKGHLRKYAELVGVPVDDILSDYYQMNRASGAPPIVRPARSRDRSISPGPWVAALLVITVAGGAAWWWYQRAPETIVVAPQVATLAPYAQSTTNEAARDVSPAATSEPAPGTVQIELQPVSESVQDPTVAAVPIPDRENSAAAVKLAEEVPARQQDQSATDVQNGDLPPLAEAAGLTPTIAVELAFSGDCWTEVTDASGKSLFYDLGTAGMVVSLSGDAPLQLVLGDSSSVSISTDGLDYPVPAPSRSGRPTRLTINSQ